MRAKGIDISPRSHTSYTYQEDHDFVMVGVTDGLSEISGYEPLLDEAQKAKITIAYHYLRSGKPWQEQVRTFLSAISGFEIDGHVVDFEKRNNFPSYDFAISCQIWIEEIKYQTGKRALTYTSPSVYQEWMFPYGVTFLADSPEKYPLMIAQYPYNTWNPVLENVPVDTSWQPRLPAGITTWRHWQYSADGNGQASKNGVTGNNDVDLQVYNGTVEQMLDWYGKESIIFPDIVGHWGEEAILDCYKKGLVSGYSDRTFRPDNYITRAEVCAIISKL